MARSLLAASERRHETARAELHVNWLAAELAFWSAAMDLLSEEGKEQGQILKT